MKKNNKTYIFTVSVVVSILLVFVYYEYKNQDVTLKLGIFAGSAYDVPNWQSYKAFDEEIEKFQAIYPNIKVEYRSGTRKEDYSEWLSGEILKGREPDIFCVLPEDFNTFASIGIMENLNEVIDDEKRLYKNEVYINALESGKFGGEQYALPREVDPQLMFVNKTLLDKEGIDLPKGNWTWAELYDICDKITKDLNGDGIIDQFGIVGFDWKMAVYTNGQLLFDKEGTESYFNNYEVTEAVTFVKKLNALNKNTKVTLDEFDKGNVAFRPFPFSAYRAYSTYPYRIIRYDQFEWECIKLPKGPKGNNASELESFAFAISKRSNNKEAAVKFLKFLTTNRTSQMDVIEYSHGVPILKDVLNSQEVKEKLSEYNPNSDNIIEVNLLREVIDKSIVTPRFQKYKIAMEIADNKIFQIINTEVDIEDSLRELNKELNKLLKD